MAILRITGGCAYETGCFSLRLAVRTYGCTVWVGRILWLSALRNLHGCESRQPLEAYPYRIRLGRPEVVLSWSSGKFFGRSDGSHGLKLNEILTTSVYSSLNRDWIDALFMPKIGKLRIGGLNLNKILYAAKRKQIHWNIIFNRIKEVPCLNTKRKPCRFQIGTAWFFGLKKCVKSGQKIWKNVRRINLKSWKNVLCFWY